MKTETTESGKILRFTVREFIAVVIAIVSVVFSATLIWTRFVEIEEHYKIEQEKQETRDELQDQRIEYVNERIDRKFKQLTEK